MHEFEIRQLTFREAIEQFGAAITESQIGQLVLLDKDSAQFLISSSSPVVPITSIVVCKVLEVNENEKTVRLLRLIEINEADAKSSISGEVTVPLAYFSKSATERISQGRKFFKYLSP